MIFFLGIILLVSKIGVRPVRNFDALHEKDKALLVKPVDPNTRKKRARPVVPWLRRTEYMIGEGAKVYGKQGELIDSSM